MEVISDPEPDTALVTMFSCLTLPQTQEVLTEAPVIIATCRSGCVIEPITASLKGNLIRREGMI